MSTDTSARDPRALPPAPPPPTRADRPPGADHPARRRPSLLGRVGGWCFDHRAGAVGLWVAAVVVLFAGAGAVGAAFTATSEVPGSDSAAGFAVLEEHFPELGTGGRSGTIVFRADQGVDDPDVRAAMERLFAEVEAGFPDGTGEPRHPGATVVSPYSTAGAGQVAGDIAFARVNLAASVDDTESGLIGQAILDHAPRLDGLEVHPGGQWLAVLEVPETELIGVAFAVVVLIVAFGSVLAMGLPIAVAAAGVGAGAALALLLSNVLPVPDGASLLGIMIGLGVGIDYALFVVTRYREALHEGRAPRDATLVAMGSAGRSVVFAGLTVVVSLLGLVLVGIGWIGGMAVGVSVTVLATMLASVTLLPALLGFAGERVEVTRWRGLIAAGGGAVALLGLGLGLDVVAAVGALVLVVTLLAAVVVAPLRRPVPWRSGVAAGRTGGGWAYRWSRTVQRHPGRWIAAAAMVLAVLAAPVAGLRLGWADEGNFPEGTPTREAYDLLADGFGPGFNGPFLITAVPSGGGGPTGDVAGVAAVERLRATLGRAPGVADVTAAVADDPAAPRAWVMTLVPTTAPQDEATSRLVTRLRDDVVPRAVAGSGLDVRITGSAAVDIDSTDYLARRMPVFFGAVLAVSFVLLMVVFRSLLVPLKAVVMNVASIAAAYGVVVAVFQWGWGGGLVGVEAGPINPFVPMMLFAIVFGLSMDYEVFLLSRIREHYDRTGDARASVADGLASTARVITAAAAIMVVVFASFLLEDNRDLKLFGLGLAVAVLLDATLIRMLLVPATMELLGDRNWWLPRRLARHLPRVSEGGVG